MAGKMYKTFFLLAFVFGDGVALCQKINTVNFKQWDQNNPLQWKDYTITHKKKILKTGFLADGVSYIQFDFVPEEWSVDSCINIVALFIKGESWVEDTLNLSLLEHERIHFDIGELHARRLRRVLYTLFTGNHKNHKTYYMKIDSLIEVAKNYQTLYDQETFYGQIHSQQQLWKDNIARELKQLEDFSFENMQSKCNDRSR